MQQFLNNSVKKNLFFVLLIFITVILQNFLSLLFTGFISSVLFIIPLFICISADSDEIHSMIFGFVTGAVLDCSSVVFDGFYAVLFVLIGFVISYLIKTRMRNNIITVFVINTIVTVIIYNLYFLLFVLKSNFGAYKTQYFQHYLIPIFIVIISAPIFFFLTGYINNKYTKKSTTYNLGEDNE